MGSEDEVRALSAAWDEALVANDPERVAAGGTVTLTARKTSAGAWGGNPYTADEWITEVYVRTGNGWRCALSQKTPAAAGP